MIYTSTQLEKDVKRINERINEVAKLLGSDSEAYNKYVARLKSLLPSKYVTIDKDGLYKIKRAKELYQRSGEEKIERAFQQILKVPTAGEIRREARRVIKEERAKYKKSTEGGAAPFGAVAKEGDAATIEDIVSGEGKITKEAIDFFAKLIDDVKKFVDDNSNMFYVVYNNNDINNTIHTKGQGRRTYGELNEIMEAYQAQQYSYSRSLFDEVD